MTQTIQMVKLTGGYEICQSDSFFKLTQDSVLLSDFANISSDERGLDLGAGIGCLGILLMLRDHGIIDGVEINADAAALAAENYRRCGLEGRGDVLAADFRSLPKEMYQKYDMCVSNPPYYNPRNGQIAAQPSLALARNSTAGDISDLCRAASLALKAGGRFYICFKPSGLDELLSALHQNLLLPKRLRLVHHSPRKRATLVLIEARREHSCELTVMPPLFITDDRGNHTAEYFRIYKDMSQPHAAQQSELNAR